MLIRYKGGRTHVKIAPNRGKPYFFTKENNRVVDITDQAVVNYIFSLPNNAEFEVVVPQQEQAQESQPEPQQEQAQESVKKGGRLKKEKK